MVVAPTILRVCNPNILGREVVDGIGVHHAVFHVLGPTPAVVVLIVAVAEDGSPAVQALLSFR